MRVLVTGASGFVGGAVAAHLQRAGHTVFGSVRNPNASVPAGVERVTWALPGPAPAGIGTLDAVVHCAALVDDAAPLAAALQVNRDGTAAVATAFPDAHFVFVSSSSVYDSWRQHRGTRESETEGARLLGSYARSKSAADAYARGVPGALVVRPHAVYGPGDTTLMPRLRSAVRNSRLLLPHGGRALHALTHVDHLATAIRLGVERRASGVINVTDGAPVTLAEAVRSALGEVDVTSVSLPFALAGARLAEGVATLSRSTPRLTAYAVLQLGNDHVYNLDAARSLLEWEPPAPRLSDLATNR